MSVESEAWNTPDSPLRLRTKLAFAVVTALGGLLLGTGADTGSLAVIIVGFSVIGFVCVDWQKLFALPSLIAYAAMAVTAVVCVAEFIQGAELLGRKMIAVAQLLAVAQSILMLQEKTHRLFEQLMIFALLNCVVSAVFNDALSYAIWFLPLALASGVALTLLAADETVTLTGEGDQNESATPNASGSTARPFSCDNGASIRSFSRVAPKITWAGMTFLLPAVMVVAAAIFFALPRQIEAQRSSSAQALVGFSDNVRLGQIGRMQLNTERALRVRLDDPKVKKPYRAIEGIYLRGRVLEHYVADRDVTAGGGSWESVPVPLDGPVQTLPPQFIPKRASDFNFFDLVHVTVRCEAMRSPALFALAPYHRTMGSESIRHRPYQWIIERKSARGAGSLSPWYPRIEYRFATQGFRDGMQTQWIADHSLAHRSRPRRRRHGYGTVFDSQPPEIAPDEKAANGLVSLTAEQLEYRDELLEYPEHVVPAAKRVAQEVIDTLAVEKRDPVTIAKQLEQHLAWSGRYEYTLNLNSKVVSEMDPIEQFLSIDRRGHCQYFAAALAMMLRSQGVPCRLVVGYHCDEFNELSQDFIVRQSHAHAWVEALIDREHLPLGANVYGQPESRRYWLRLDPSPSGGAATNHADAGRRQQIAEMAKNLWNDYVVDMSPQVQKSTLLSTPGFAPMTSSYQDWIESAKTLAFRINAGEIHGIGGGRLFSTSAAIAAVVLGLTALIFLKIQFPNWLRRKRRRKETEPVARPGIAFYAEALELLEKAGYTRSRGQTPAELTATLPNDSLQDPMNVLTQLYYRLRYRAGLAGASRVDDDPATDSQSSITESLSKVRSQVRVHHHHRRDSHSTGAARP